MSRNLRGRKLFDALTKFDEELVSCVFMTYNFESSYFENRLLPKILNVRQDEHEDERIVNIDLINRLQQIDFNVIVDGRANLRERKNLYGYKLIPIFNTTHHSKIYFFQFQDSFKVIIASANLTQDGIHRNKETYTEFIFDRKSEYWHVFDDVVEYLSVLNDENNAGLEKLIQSYIDLAIEIKGEESVEQNRNVRFVGVGPTLNSIDFNQLLEDFFKYNEIESIREKRVDALYVCSAFYEEDQDNYKSSLLYKNWEKLKGEHKIYPEVYIYLPSNDDNVLTLFPHNAYSGVNSNIRDKLFIYKNPQDITVGNNEIRRFPHLKMYAVVNLKRYSMFLVGSSNFSPSAFGNRGKKSNWEANIVMFNDHYDKNTIRSIFPKDKGFEHDVLENPDMAEFETKENPDDEVIDRIYLSNVIYEEGKIRATILNSIEGLIFKVANQKLEVSQIDELFVASLDKLEDYCLEVRNNEEELLQILPIEVKDQSFDPFELKISNDELVDWIEGRYLYKGERPLSLLLEKLKSKSKGKAKAQYDLSTDDYLMYRVKAFNNLISSINNRLEELSKFPKRIRYHLLGKFGLINCVQEYLNDSSDEKLGVFSIYQAVELVTSVLSSLSSSPNQEVLEIMDVFWKEASKLLDEADMPNNCKGQVSFYLEELKRYKTEIDQLKEAS